MFTASGLIVRFLKVFEKSNYQRVKWVRYLTKVGGSYQIRVSKSCLSLEKQIVLIHGLDVVLRRIPARIPVAILLCVYRLFRALQTTLLSTLLPRLSPALVHYVGCDWDPENSSHNQRCGVHVKR